VTDGKKKPARTRAERAAVLLEREKEVRKQRTALERKIRGKEASERKRADTRRKVLVGAYMLEELVGGDEKGQAWLARIIDKRAVKEGDRKFLSPLYKQLTGKDLPQSSPPEPTVMLASEAKPDGEVMAS